MVVVEGVARTLNPDLNMWVAAEPVVRSWIERKLGPVGRIETGVTSLGRMAMSLPTLFEDAARASTMLSDMAKSGGLRLDRETTEALARAEARRNRPLRVAAVIGAAALVAIAVALFRL
jgi:ubiquinone biosynthesis protein